MKSFFRRRWYFFIPLIILAFVAFGIILMSLWNFVMPAIFSLPVITFWQAICLLILSRILFSGGGKSFGHHRWQGHFRNKWNKMSPEDREKFYQRWNSHCCPGNSRKEEAAEI